jgi:hypothetical protein
LTVWLRFATGWNNKRWATALLLRETAEESERCEEEEAHRREQEEH